MAVSPTPSPDRITFALRGPLSKRLARTLTKFLVLPLIGMLLSGMIIGRIANAFIGTKTYYVYIVGDEKEPSVNAMMNAVSKGEGSYASLGGATVMTEVQDDSGDPQEAATISQQLAKRPDVLMVVGHVYSTTTKSALPNYMEADPPIPVILTTETNPNLLPPPPPPRPGEVSVPPPVFRLFPTDENQATVAAQFLAAQHAQSVWVIEDTTNITYSQYLTRQFLKVVYDQQVNNQQTPMKVILWSNNLNLPPYSVDKLGIDWVFFAGDWRNALVLVRQLKALPGTKKPKVLLSDASADSLLLKYGGDDVEGLYLLHPMPADVFNKSGYVAVGEEASKLSIQLVAKVHENFDDLATGAAPVSYRLRKWFGLHRVSDARRALARYMSAVVMKQDPDPIVSDGSTITMGRDESGAVIRKDASFHVWRIDRNPEGTGFRFVQAP